MSDKCCCKKKTHKCDRDVCATPICGRPNVLSVYAPVVYDEIGINVCRPVTLPQTVMTANPTVSCVQLEVVDIAFIEESCGIPETCVTNHARANCSTVVLTNVSVTFRVKLFDDCENYLASTMITANYLPGSSKSPDAKYCDEETNPSSVAIELYTPYGVGYMVTSRKPYINVVELFEGSNKVENGINASAVAKAMNFDSDTGTFSAGISIILRTVYYETYKIKHEGKPVPPKASLSEEDDNVGLEFVESDLLSREIKPLELEPPKCEERFKEQAKTTCEMDSCTRGVHNACPCTKEENNCHMAQLPAIAEEIQD